MDALDVAIRFLKRDLSQRVELTIKAIVQQGHKQAFYRGYERWPEFGVVPLVADLPVLTTSGFDKRSPLHYVDVDGVHYFPYLGEDAGTGESSILRLQGCTFLPSLGLLMQVWNGIQDYTNRFPVISAAEIVTWDGREKDLKTLLEADYHIQLGAYTTNNVPVSVQRMLASGFVTQFGFPGEEWKWVNSYETSVNIIGVLEGRQARTGDGGVVNKDDLAFIRGLKEMCYNVQQEHGSFAAKYAWELYKRTARYLSDGESERVS